MSSRPSAFSQLCLVTHRWVGIVAAVVLLVVALTGTIITYHEPLDRLLYPRLMVVTPAGDKQPLSRTLATAIAAAPDRRVMWIERSALDDGSDRVVFQDGISVTVDPYRNAVLGEWRPSRSFTGRMHGLHGSLLAGAVGHWLVGLSALAVVFETITGLVRWWRYKSVWVSLRRKFRRVMFDLHNATGVLAIVVLLPVSVTGLMLSFGSWFAPLARLDPPATPPAAPGTPVPGLAAALDAALALRPGSVAGMNLPRRPDDPLTVSIRPAGDASPYGIVRVVIDTTSGVPRRIEEPSRGAGSYLLYLRDAVHGGWIWGWPSLLLVALSGLALAAQAVTGVLVWWKPRLD